MDVESEPVVYPSWREYFGTSVPSKFLMKYYLSHEQRTRYTGAELLNYIEVELAYDVPLHFSQIVDFALRDISGKYETIRESYLHDSTD